MSKLKSGNVNRDYERLFMTLPQHESPVLGPKGGFSYVYTWQEEHKQGDWRSDTYRWRQSGYGKFSIGNIKGRKTYFLSVTGKDDENQEILSNLFVKHSYEHPNFPQKIMIDYIGDETISSKLPHGNSVSSHKANKSYVRTMPSVLRDIERENGIPSVVYRNKLTTAPRELIRQQVESVKDLEQVQNTKKNAAKKFRLSNDAIFNVSELAHDLDFITQMFLYPNVTIIGCNKNLAGILNELLSRSDLKPMALSYDTTFKLCDAYVSVLSFIETEFEGSPVVPVMICVHERKTKDVHDALWRTVAERFPALLKAKNVYITTDEESAIVSAILKYCPKVDVFRCWNHILQNVRLKLRKLGICKNEDVNKYTDEVLELFEKKSLDDYNECLLIVMTLWNKDFAEYFRKNIHCDIDRIGSWVLKKYDLTSATNNVAESVNAILKRMFEWKEGPIDCIVLALYRLLESFYAEIIRGRYGLGTYNLLPQFTGFYNLEKDCPTLPEVHTAEGIFDTVKNSRMLANCVIPKEEGIEKDKTESDDEIYLLSSYERALRILDEKKYSFDANVRAFTVAGTNSARIVQLFPTPTCSCEATRICYHIIAIQLAVGLNKKRVKHKRPGNSTLFRKRIRKAADKTSGRKKPRKMDVDNDNENSLWKDLNDDRDWGVEEEEDDIHFQIHDLPIGNKNIANEDESCVTIKKELPKLNAENEEATLKPKESIDEKIELKNQVASQLDKSRIKIRTEDPKLNAENVGATLEPKETIDKKNELKNQVTSQLDASRVKIRIEDPDAENEDAKLQSTRSKDEKNELKTQVASQPEPKVNADDVLLVECNEKSVEQLQSTSAAKNVTTIRPTDEVHPRRDEQLSSREIDGITKTSWLKSSHVNSALALLRKKSPAVGGLFNVQWGASDKNYPPANGSQWIQVIHNGNNHWLLAAFGFLKMKPSEVAVFDSSRSKNMSRHVISTCACLLKTPLSSFTLHVMSNQTQDNGNDCGIYAFAFANALLEQKDPTTMLFDTAKLRDHFINCLRTGKMTSFPTLSSSRRVNERTRSVHVDVPVTCICRRPVRFKAEEIQHKDEDMAQCEHCQCWFHRVCEKIPNSVFLEKNKKKPWICSNPKCQATILKKKSKNFKTK